MARFLPLTLLMVLSVEGAFAQGLPPVPFPPMPPLELPEAQTEPPVPDVVVPLVPGTRRMTTKIAFVVDVSLSMRSYGRVQMGITFARDLLGRPDDELLIQLFAFRKDVSRWPGIKPDPSEQQYGPPPPEGWTEFPSVAALESAQRWLSAQGTSGGTNPTKAMIAALQLQQRDLSVVLITDGEFKAHEEEFLAAVKVGQAIREAKGLGRAVIFVIGTGPAAAQEQHLLQVGKENGGGVAIIMPQAKKPTPAVEQPAPPLPDDIK